MFINNKINSTVSETKTNIYISEINMTSTAIPSMRSSRPANNYNAIPADVYPARIVRFVGLGIQDQPMYEGQKKDPAFKCAIQFELIGLDATGTKADGTPLEPRPSCVFQDYFLFPGASRGKVFDMCRAIDPSMDAAPKTLDWFIDKLNSVVMVQVGTYKTKDGATKNKVVAVQPCPGFMKNNVEPARSDIVGFIPYVDSEANLSAYNKLFKFQRDMLLEAHDSANIPFAGKEVVFQSAQEPAAPSKPAKPVNMPYTDENDDDDIPF